jgi:hypothetical protein
MSGYNIDPRYTDEAGQARLRHMLDQQLRREQVQIEREQLDIMRQQQQAQQAQAQHARYGFGIQPTSSSDGGNEGGGAVIAALLAWPSSVFAAASTCGGSSATACRVASYGSSSARPRSFSRSSRC